jgi:hypothetical protein
MRISKNATGEIDMKNGLRIPPRQPFRVFLFRPAIPGYFPSSAEA